MRILNRYIAKNMIVSMLMAVGILTFVMLSGQFFRAFDLISRGVSPWLLCRYLLYLVPDMLRFTLPLAMLVATVLVLWTPLVRSAAWQSSHGAAVLESMISGLKPLMPAELAERLPG